MFPNCIEWSISISHNNLPFRAGWFISWEGISARLLYFVKQQPQPPKLCNSSPERLWVYGRVQQHHGTKQGDGEEHSQHQEGGAEHSATEGAARDKAQEGTGQGSGRMAAVSALWAGAALPPGLTATTSMSVTKGQHCALHALALLLTFQRVGHSSQLFPR